jgi:hypothetical protein
MLGFGHIGIPTTDFKKARKFFGSVFGWTFQELTGTTYLLFRAGNPPNGSFYVVKKMPKKGQVNVYIEVDDIDSKLKDIRKARGKVLLKKTPVGTMGWMAQFSTPDGCFLSLWQSAPRSADAQAATPII